MLHSKSLVINEILFYDHYILQKLFQHAVIDALTIIDKTLWCAFTPTSICRSLKHMIYNTMQNTRCLMATTRTDWIIKKSLTMISYMQNFPFLGYEAVCLKIAIATLKSTWDNMKRRIGNTNSIDQTTYRNQRFVRWLLDYLCSTF